MNKGSQSTQEKQKKKSNKLKGQSNYKHAISQLYLEQKLHINLRDTKMHIEETYKVNFQDESACNKNNQDGDGEENPSRHYALNTNHCPQY